MRLCEMNVFKNDWLNTKGCIKSCIVSWYTKVRMEKIKLTNPITSPYHSAVIFEGF